MSHRIALVGGDGIGPEVTAQGLKVARAAGADLDVTEYELGGARYLRDGVVLTDEIVEELRGFDAIYLGAVGHEDCPPGLIERGILLKLRFDLDLYVNLRPFSGRAAGTRSDSRVGGPQPASGRAAGTRPAGGDESDVFEFAVVRENTEGSYAGEGGFLRQGTPHEVATQGSVNTRMGVERCVRFAFELAQRSGEPHVTLVHKTNVLTFSGDLWQRAFDAVAAEHPDVDTAYDHVDAACIHLVEDPHRYSVVVTDNLFGDILTDLAGAVSGGIGLAASANLNPARTGPSLFEPVHGSAPDIVGTGRANPIAAILSAAMMLEFLGDRPAADRIRLACADPGELDGRTNEIGDAVVDRLRSQER